MTISKFTKENLAEIRTQLKDALKQIEDNMGITLSIGNISFSEDGFTTKLIGAVVGENADSLGNANWVKGFNDYCALWGFKKSDLGRTFLLDNKETILIGARPKAKYPLVISQNGSNKAASVEHVLNSINR